MCEDNSSLEFQELSGAQAYQQDALAFIYSIQGSTPSHGLLAWLPKQQPLPAVSKYSKSSNSPGKQQKETVAVHEAIKAVETVYQHACMLKRV